MGERIITKSKSVPPSEVRGTDIVLARQPALLEGFQEAVKIEREVGVEVKNGDFSLIAALLHGEDPYDLLHRGVTDFEVADVLYERQAKQIIYYWIIVNYIQSQLNLHDESLLNPATISFTQKKPDRALQAKLFSKYTQWIGTANPGKKTQNLFAAWHRAQHVVLPPDYTLDVVQGFKKKAWPVTAEAVRRQLWIDEKNMYKRKFFLQRVLRTLEMHPQLLNTFMGSLAFQLAEIHSLYLKTHDWPGIIQTKTFFDAVMVNDWLSLLHDIPGDDDVDSPRPVSVVKYNFFPVDQDHAWVFHLKNFLMQASATSFAQVYAKSLQRKEAWPDKHQLGFVNSATELEDLSQKASLWYLEWDGVGFVPVNRTQTPEETASALASLQTITAFLNDPYKRSLFKEIKKARERRFPTISSAPN